MWAIQRAQISRLGHSDGTLGERQAGTSARDPQQRGLARGPVLAPRLGGGSASMLVVGKVLESFQRIGSRKIQSATRAEEAGAAALGTLIHQAWSGNRSRRRFSQNGSFARIVRLRA